MSMTLTYDPDTRVLIRTGSWPASSLTEAELLAGWRAQVAIGKAVHPELYGVRIAPDWNPPVKRVSIERKYRRRKSHSRKRPT